MCCHTQRVPVLLCVSVWFLQIWALFWGYKDIFGSPWNIRNPPDCRRRWAENHGCSKRGQAEQLAKIGGIVKGPRRGKDPSQHRFQVSVCMSGSVSMLANVAAAAYQPG